MNTVVLCIFVVIMVIMNINSLGIELAFFKNIAGCRNVDGVVNFAKSATGSS